MQTVPSSLPLSRCVDPTKPMQVTVPLWYRSSPASARRRRSYSRMCSSLPPDTRSAPALAPPLGMASARMLPWWGV